MPLSTPLPPPRLIWVGGLARWLACAFLLLGAGLAVGALYLPWWRYTNEDGSPVTDPSYSAPIVPAVSFGLGDVRVQLLLECVVVAIVMGLVAPALPRRMFGVPAALATVAACSGLAGLAVAYLTTHWSLLTYGVLTVSDSGYSLYNLGCALILAGAVTLAALSVSMRRSRTLLT